MDISGDETLNLRLYKTVEKILFHSFDGEGANGASARTTTTRTMKFQHIRSFSSEWNTRCTADFLLQRRGRNTNNKMTRTRWLVVNIFAAHKLLHVLLFILCISRPTYDASAALHIQCMYDECSIFFLLSIAAPIFVMYNYIVERMSGTARHSSAHAREKWEWQQWNNVIANRLLSLRQCSLLPL